MKSSKELVQSKYPKAFAHVETPTIEGGKKIAVYQIKVDNEVYVEGSTEEQAWEFAWMKIHEITSRKIGDWRKLIGKMVKIRTNRGLHSGEIMEAKGREIRLNGDWHSLNEIVKAFTVPEESTDKKNT